MSIEDKVKNLVGAWCPDFNQYARQQFEAELLAVLLESPDIILIRRDAEGNWPKKVRQTVASAIAEAASRERWKQLTNEAFVAIQTRLLDELAAL